MQPEKPAEVVFHHYRGLYIRYLKIYQKLERCYEGMIHPQKRQQVKTIIEALLVRLLIIRSVLVKWHPLPPDVKTASAGKPFPWEYINFDDLLVEHRMQPEALDIPAPACFVDAPTSDLSDGINLIKARDSLINNYMRLKLGVERVLVEIDGGSGGAAGAAAAGGAAAGAGGAAEGEGGLPPPAFSFTVEEAVAIIQRNERGRQGKLAAAAFKARIARGEAAEEAGAAGGAAAGGGSGAASKLGKARGSGGYGSDSGIGSAGSGGLARRAGGRSAGLAGGGGGTLSRQASSAAAGGAGGGLRSRGTVGGGHLLSSDEEDEDGDDEDDEDVMEPEEAAVMMQKLARGFLCRKRAQRSRRAEASFIGTANAMRPGLSLLESTLAETAERRLQLQHEQKENYSSAMPSLLKQVTEEDGPSVRDALRAERTAWYTTKLSSGTVPETIDAYYAEKNAPPVDPAAEAAAAAGGKGGKGGKADDKKKDDKKKDDKKKKGAAEEAPADLPPPLHATGPWVLNMGGLVSSYRGLWQGRDEKDNPLQKHDSEIARAMLRPKVEAELVTQVDAELNNEMANLKKAMGGDKEKKKGAKAAKKKGAKAPKSKVKPLKGAKLTKDMPIDEMLIKLVDLRMVNNARSDATFRTFYGGINLLGSKYASSDTPAQRHPSKGFWMPAEPSMAQVRELVMHYGVLPLGSAAVREMAVATLEQSGSKEGLPRSLLLYGPKGAGKTHLVQAVANATGAMLINLSFSHLEANAADYLLLLQMAWDVGKDPKLGPVLIYLDEVEKLLPGAAKKKGADAGAGGGGGVVGPKFKKDFPAYVKALTPQDRIFIIGCTSEPQEADPKAMADCFERSAYVPLPDYSTRLKLWQQLARDTLLQVGYEAAPAVSSDSADFAESLAADIAQLKLRPWSMDGTASLPGGGAAAAGGAAAGGAAGGAPPASLLSSLAPSAKVTETLSGLVLPLSPASAAAPAGGGFLLPALEHLNWSALASVSGGYSTGSIKKAVKAAITPRRLERLKVRPFAENEFLSALARCPRVYSEDFEKYRAFGDKITGLEVRRLPAADDGGKDKKKGKK